MTDLRIERIDAAKLRIHCERWLLEELAQTFEFFAPNYRFHPKFKNKIWNGKISLIDRMRQTAPAGILRDIIKFVRDRDYEYIIDQDLLDERYVPLDDDKFDAWIDSLPLDPSKPPRDYQIESVKSTLKNRRLICLSATASGKSLSIYLLVRWLIEVENTNQILIIVPTVNLVKQLYSDFDSYDPTWEMLRGIAQVYAGQDRSGKQRILISTWQSLNEIADPTWFEGFTAVVFDECHLAKANVSSAIMNCLKNATLRVGLTGTLDGSQTHEMALRGLFGKPIRFSSTHDLIERGILARMSIQPIVLDYPEEIRREYNKQKRTYHDEIEFIVDHPGRMKFLVDLAKNIEGNSLFMFRRIDSHAVEFYNIIKQMETDTIKVHLMVGKTDVDVREYSRREIDSTRDVTHIVVGSEGVVSTGTNIVNLDNLIFCHPMKGKIRNLQSVGRVLRKGDQKSSAMVYDIVDDVSWKSKHNYALRHFEIRLNNYIEEGLDVLNPIRRKV